MVDQILLRFTPFPELTTDRLKLRQLSDLDGPDIFRLRKNPQVGQFLDRPKAKNVAEAQAFIKKINAGIMDDHWIYWAITRKEDTGVIGTICLWNFSEKKDQAEVGFEMLPEFQRYGFTNESLKSVLYYAFVNLKLLRIEAYTHPENIPSIQLLNKNQFCPAPTPSSDNNKIQKIFILSQNKYLQRNPHK